MSIASVTAIRHSWLLCDGGRALISLEGARKFEVVKNQTPPGIGSQGPSWCIDLTYDNGDTETIGYDPSEQACIELIGNLWKALQKHDLVFLEIKTEPQTEP